MTDMRSRLKRGTRRVAALGAVSYAAIFLAGCGGAASSSTVASQNPSGSSPVQQGSLRSTIGSSTANAPAPTAPPQPGIPAGARIERTANVSLEVKADQFDTTLDRTFGVMRELKGYVSGSDISGDSGGLRSGTISFRVPSASFEDAISRVRNLGTVRGLSVGGTDVSSQYVDLQARLRNQQAQEQAMLALYAQAKGVQDIVAVQNQLATIGDQIERLKGQIAFFDSQVDYSTLTVRVSQAGLVSAAGNDEWGFKTALLQAAHYGVSSLDVVVVVIGASLPILVLAGFAAVLARPVLRRARSGPRPA
ncbi:MAG: DUF4349 domain-containing protein [Candidatus Dormibacteria bacterium]